MTFGMFNPGNSLVVTINCELILWGKMGLFLNVVKPTTKSFLNSKDSKYVLIFLSLHWLLSCLCDSVIFLYIEIAKQIWHPCCHLAADLAWSAQNDVVYSARASVKLLVVVPFIKSISTCSKDGNKNSGFWFSVFLANCHLAGWGLTERHGIVQPGKNQNRFCQGILT